MDRAKLRLSTEEMDLISRTDWILTKNRLMMRVREMLASLQEQQWQCLREAHNPLPDEVMNIPAKISRGENYEGLPWMVLDLPRYFTSGDQLAIRTLFWWGHGFSLTLQLQGRFHQQFQSRVDRYNSILRQQQWHICIGDDPWQHHFRSDNYIPIASMTEGEWKRVSTHHPFLKIACFIPMEKWEQAPELLLQQYRLLSEIL